VVSYLSEGLTCLNEKLSEAGVAILVDVRYRVGTWVGGEECSWHSNPAILC
jgi:hypothetical protein